MKSSPRKKSLVKGLFIGLILFVSYTSPQQIKHDVSVINIEVPVRVFKGNSFVDELSVDDFEVYEDGILQKIDSMHLIRKMEVQRAEGEIKSVPHVSRNFMLIFEMKRPLPRLRNAIVEFFEKAATPEDKITIITPVGSFVINSQAMGRRPRKEIGEETYDKIRSDIMKAAAEYRFLINNLYDLRYDRSLEEDVKKQMYGTIAEKITNLSCIEENKVLKFADTLKRMPGQKYVFIFYQQEVIPVLEQAITWEDLEEIWDQADMGKKYNPGKVQQAFSDASIMCNFIYITEKSLDTHFSMGLIPDERPNLYMKDTSIGIFNSFKEIARASGGMTEISANAVSAFRKVLNATESYYLLYYTPKNYQADGRFHEIIVKLKTGKYKVIHRRGYEAR